jgi:hypothetical protein
MNLYLQVYFIILIYTIIINTDNLFNNKFNDFHLLVDITNNNILN